MSLPDDVFLEIFLRIKDVAALFRCATVCKGWRDVIISNLSFLRRCLPAEEPWRLSCPFAGFFTQQRRRGNRDLPVPCFVPGPRPVLGHRGLLSSFVPGMGDLAVPLASRHGLLLARIGRLLIVCNPLAGTFKPLPPLDQPWVISPGRSTGYAMLTAADCSSSDQHHDHHKIPFFKVMIVVVAHEPMHYDLHTYSSAGDSAGWTTCSSPGTLADHVIRVKNMQHNVAVRRGVALWFVSDTSRRFYFIYVCARTGQNGVKILVDTTLRNILNHPAYDEPYLSVDAKGRLVYLCLLVDGSRLHIWSHEGVTNFNIILQPPSQRMNNLIGQGAVHKCLGEKNGMLIISDEHQRVYLADVKTGVMQEIMDCPRGHGLSRKEIVPMEMDWPALFISRLGVVAA